MIDLSIKSNGFLHENDLSYNIDQEIKHLEISLLVLVVHWATRPKDMVAQHIFMVVSGVRTLDLSSPE